MMKRALSALLVMLIMLSGAAFAETALPIPVGGSHALIRPNGDVLVEPGKYEWIYPVGGESETTVFAAGGTVGEAFLYALLDPAGEPLTEQVYDMLYPIADGFVGFMQNKLYGVMDLTGAVVAGAEYTSIVSNGEGGFLATTTDCWDDEPDGLYYIASTGEMTATGVKTVGTVGVFTKGYMPLLSAENNKYGYVAPNGQWAIRAQFDYAENFSGNYAWANLASGTGLIDRAGSWALSPEYDEIYGNDEVFIVLTGGDTCRVLDAQTLIERFSVTGENIFASLTDTTVQIYTETAVTLYTFAGEKIYEGASDAAFGEGTFGQTVVYEGSWGSQECSLLGANGAAVAGPYQWLYYTGETQETAYYTFMTFESALCYSDFTGEEVYDWDMDTARYGLIDHTGKVLMPAEYDLLYWVAEDVFFAEKDGLAGAVNARGEWIYTFAEG